MDEVKVKSSPAGTENGALISKPKTQDHKLFSGHSTPNSSDVNPVKLFVCNLDRHTSIQKLRQYFGMFGEVVKVYLARNSYFQLNRGYAFVKFLDPESAKNVLKVPFHILDGKAIEVRYADSNNRPNRIKSVFVGGVSKELSSEEVKAYFDKFGLIKFNMILDWHTKRPRGFGFLAFQSEDAANQVCELHYHMINKTVVECKKAQPKSHLLQQRSVRGLVGTVPIMTVAPELVAPISFFATQVHAQNAAVGDWYERKMYRDYSGLTGYRFAPYPVNSLTQSLQPLQNLPCKLCIPCKLCFPSQIPKLPCCQQPYLPCRFPY